MQLGARIRATFNSISHGGFTASGAIIWCVVILVLMEIVARYFFTYPMGWVVEIVEYLLLYICFLGAAWLLKSEGHVRMDMVLKRLNPQNQARLSAITSLLGAIICLVIAWYSGVMTLDLFQRGVMVTSTLEPPKAAVTVIIPVGSFLLFIEFLRKTYGHIGRWRA